MGEPVRLIGVGVSGLAPEQLNLWDHQTKMVEIETEKRLSTAISDLREKFGDNVLKWGDDFENHK